MVRMGVSLITRLGIFLLGLTAYTTGQGINVGVIPTWYDEVTSQRDQDSINIQFVNLSVSEKDEFKARFDKVKEQIGSENLKAIIGPFDNAVSLAAEEKNIPYLATTPVTEESLLYTIQLFPEMEEFGKAILEFAHRQEWKQISVLYDDDKGLTLIQRLMTSHNLNVKAWRLDDPEKHEKNKMGDPNKIMKSRVRQALVQIRRLLVQHSIVFCSKENTKHILEEARDLGMFMIPYEWAFLDPGNILQDLFEPNIDVTVNFTLFTLLEDNTKNKELNDALAHDAVKLLTSAVVNSSKRDLLTAIKENQEEGETGYLQLDQKGKRDNISIYLTAITGTHGYPERLHAHRKHGIWYQQEISNQNHKHLVLYDCLDCQNRTRLFPLKGRTVDVVMIEQEPFTMLKSDHTFHSGNEKYEGYAMDLLKKVAEKLEFNFRIYIVPDGNFGRKKNGEWNGMIKELLDGKAAMSVAPLSINSEREVAIDFTKPFKSRYLNVILKIPKIEVSLFQFLRPLSTGVWWSILTAFVVVSVVLYTLERIASRIRKTTEISVKETFWFTVGSLLQGNTDSCQISIPGRILSCSWWVFILILSASYTANMAAFLTVKRINTPIETVQDLPEQTKVKYGTVKNSGVESFFTNTNIEYLSKMWAQMSEIDPDSMVDNSAEGYAKVKDGDYAFIWDATVNNYKTVHDCEMMTIFPHFDPKGYGIGVPPGASYREDLSLAILQLGDKGVLEELEQKWWDISKCPDFDKPEADETSELKMKNVAGVFFILVGGIVIAGLACLAESMVMYICKTNEAP